MANRFSVAIEIGAQSTGHRGSDFCDYRIYVGTSSNEDSWFGYVPRNRANYLYVADHQGNVLRYIGYPEASRWDSYITPNSGQEPAWELRSQSWVTGYDNLPGAYGKLIARGDTFITDWIRVNIQKGTAKKGSVTLSAGVKSRSNHSSSTQYGDNLRQFTLYTTETPDATFTSEPQVTLTETTLTISGSYTNPENYYRVKIYDGTTSIYTTPEGQTSYTYTINLTEAMYGTTKTYTVKLVGKDGTALTNQKTVSVTIPKRAFNIWMKQNGNINKDKKVYFKNVSNKEPKNIWVKKNNQIHKVKR